MFDAINNGGAAFPRPASKGTDYITGETDVVVDPQQGMSLRDFFAAKAMEGDWASQNEKNWVYRIDVSENHLDDIAALYYRMADAMLRARAKR